MTDESTPQPHTTRSADRHRPVSVTLAVVLVALLAVSDGVLGAILLLGASRSEVGLDEELVGVAASVGWSALALTAALVAVAVGLARGSNPARLLLTLLLLFRFGFELYARPELAASSTVRLVLCLLYTSPSPRDS